MPEGSIIDLEDLIIDYARVEYDEKERNNLEKKFGKLPWDKVRYTIDRSKFFIIHQNPLHVEEEKIPEFEPRHTVLFKSNYNNTTSQAMEYNISTERRTRSSITCTITRGFRLGANFELNVAPPGIEAKLGISTEVTFDKSVQSTTEKEINWNINTRINVPAHRNVTAELWVKEDEYKGSFSVRTDFSGKIYVDIYKDNTDLCRIIISNLRTVFTEKHGFQHDRDGRVFYMTTGICNCRYGVEQDVHLQETPEMLYSPNK